MMVGMEREKLRGVRREFPDGLPPDGFAEGFA
jgi:hypothetical protein